MEIECLCGRFFFLCVYMNEPYSILMQKMKGGSPIKDLVGDFDIVCVEIPFEPFGKQKILPQGIGRMKTVKTYMSRRCFG